MIQATLIGSNTLNLIVGHVPQTLFYTFSSAIQCSNTLLG